MDREPGGYRYVARNLKIKERKVGTIVVEELQDIPEARIVKLELHESVSIDSEALRQLQTYVNIIRDMQKEQGRQVLAEVKVDDRTVRVGPIYTAFEEASLAVALIMLAEVTYKHSFLF